MRVETRAPVLAYGFLFSVWVGTMVGVDFGLIRERVSIGQVLELLGLEPSSKEGSQLRGPCPIHRSTSVESRSFSVNLERNAFRCFSCGAQGNQIDLWSKTKSLSLIEAARDLSRRFELSNPGPDVEDVE